MPLPILPASILKDVTQMNDWLFYRLSIAPLTIHTSQIAAKRFALNFYIIKIPEFKFQNFRPILND